MAFCWEEVSKLIRLQGKSSGAHWPQYPSDVFVPIDELFHTENQVEKFLKTMEGCTYRLKQ